MCVSNTKTILKARKHLGEKNSEVRSSKITTLGAARKIMKNNKTKS